MTRRFLGALQFLTVLPVRRETGRLGDAAIFYPLMGALLGLSAGAVASIFSPLLGRSLGALLALAWLAIVTGCLHEDGLADVADAVRAGRSRQKMMAILKDSRIGTYGAVALILSLALRWQAMAQIVHQAAGLAAALSLSRASLVALAGAAPPIGSGMGQAFAIDCSRRVMGVVVAQAVGFTGLAAVFIGWRPAVGMLAATTLVVAWARLFFSRRLGGVNGDCLGATCQTVEMVNLVILACRYSI